MCCAIHFLMFKQNVIKEVRRMAKQEVQDKYNATFPTVLRQLMEKHPVTGLPTTQKALAEVIGIRPQTLSLYANGITQPNPDTLLNIAKYFDVSVDYMLTGVSSYNKDINKELGLSEESIRKLQVTNRVQRLEGMPRITDMVNQLLSDGEFYDFLDNIAFKVNNVRSARNLASDQKKGIGGVDVEEYYIWDLQMYIQEFIRKQLVKNGLEIENN